MTLAAESSDTSYAAKKLLVIDDQQSILEAVEHICDATLGCDIRTRLDGDSALAYLEENTVDLVVTDMVMQGTHGLELVRKIKEIAPDTNIIVMTGYPSDFPYIDVIRAGADDFISKPFHHGEMEAKILRLFREQDLKIQHRQAEGKYQSLFELNADGMMLLNGTNYQIDDVNKAFLQMRGDIFDDICGKSVFDLFSGSPLSRLQHWLTVCKERGHGTLADVVMVVSNDEEKHLDISATFIHVDPEPLLFLFFKDVTENREIVERLKDVAQRDPLTSLFNKRTLKNRLDFFTASSQSTEKPLTMISIDLDNFKQCNDTHGHQTGDALLHRLGKLISRCVRSGSSDSAFRCGGDEFMILLYDAPTAAAERIAKRLQEEFLKIENYGTSMSIGIAEYKVGNTPEEFVKRADEALYKAKNSGKDTIRFAD